MPVQKTPFLDLHLAVAYIGLLGIGFFYLNGLLPSSLGIEFGAGDEFYRLTKEPVAGYAIAFFAVIATWIRCGTLSPRFISPERTTRYLAGQRLVVMTNYGLLATSLGPMLLAQIFASPGFLFIQWLGLLFFAVGSFFSWPVGLILIWSARKRSQ